MQNATQRLTGPGSPFELVETRIDGVPCRVFRHGPRTLPDIYRKAAARRPYVVVDRHEVSYDEVLLSAQALGQELANRHGVRMGTRVGIILHNCPAWPVALLAITSIGAIATLIHRQRPATERLADLDLCQCAVVIADPQGAHELRELGDRRPVIVIRDGAYQDLPATATSLPEVCLDPEQEALIAFTSGSSSRPKGVVLTHRSIVTGMMNMMLAGAVAAIHTQRRTLAADIALRAAQPACFVAAPFSHAGGYFNLLLMAHLGGKVVTQSSWNPATALELVCQQRARSLTGATPAMIRELLSIDRCQYDLRAFGSIGIHGSAAHPGLIDEIHAALPDITIGTGYGLTETNGSVCTVSGPQLLERPTTSGQPLRSVDLRVDEAGEIWIRGAMLMRGYCAAPEATAEALRDGWLRTGDLGTLDTDGYLHVIDRRSNSIVCSGRSLSAAEIENVLMKHPAVGEAAAIGVERTPVDQRLVLCVVPKAGQKLDETDLEHHATRAIRDTEAQIVILESLPRTPSGKIDRSELRRRASVRRPTEIFSDQWYAGCRDGSVDAARLYTGYLWQLLQPRSVLDVGCGRGHWLRAWGERGSTQLIGLDGEWNRQEQMIDCAIRFIATDLSRPFALAHQVDLAMSLEVAEHLQPEAAATFIDCLTASSDLVLFSAACPHQGGPNHLNERPATYWAALFRARGFQPFDILRPVFWDDDRIPFWYRQNAFLYARENSVRSHDLMSKGLKPMEHIAFMDCVHPKLYGCKIGDIAALKARQASHPT